MEEKNNLDLSGNLTLSLARLPKLTGSKYLVDALSSSPPGGAHAHLHRGGVHRLLGPAARVQRPAVLWSHRAVPAGLAQTRKDGLQPISLLQQVKKPHDITDVLVKSFPEMCHYNCLPKQ